MLYDRHLCVRVCVFMFGKCTLLRGPLFNTHVQCTQTFTHFVLGHYRACECVCGNFHFQEMLEHTFNQVCHTHSHSDLRLLWFLRLTTMLGDAAIRIEIIKCHLSVAATDAEPRNCCWTLTRVRYDRDRDLCGPSAESVRAHVMFAFECRHLWACTIMNTLLKCSKGSPLR